jgi:transcriptional regulator PpsR
VNHARPGAPDLPLRVFTLPASTPGWTLVIGRDLRSAARMQQRLLDAQQSMEREYTKAREAETRFRLLFQIATEGVVIISGQTFKTVDINPAAARLFSRSARELEGASLDGLFGGDAPSVRETLSIARKTGRTEQLDVRPVGADDAAVLSASAYRQGQDVFFLCRMGASTGQAPATRDASLSRLAEILPDGLVLTGEDGKILSVNDGFLDIAQLHGAEEAIGVSFDQFLGRTEVEFNVLVANLREHGVIRHFATSVRSRLDIQEPVEVSAVSAPGPSGRVFGFSIRPVGRRMVAAKGADGALPSTVEQLSDLVGRVALKDIVRESTDMIERSCIEAALQLTNDNRASAAEILGLSRQSLYAKMHRHKIGSLSPKSDT